MTIEFGYSDRTNCASLTAIEDSIFLMCLDQEVPEQNGVSSESRQATHALHGSGSAYNSGNRWFDKTLQVKSNLIFFFSTFKGQPLMITKIKSILIEVVD